MDYPTAPISWYLTAPTSWELALQAVQSFDGSQPLTFRQLEAIDRSQLIRSTPGPILGPHRVELIDILNDIFFLGEICPKGKDEVRWICRAAKRGCKHKKPPPKTVRIHRQGEELAQSKECEDCTHSKELTVRVILHEMIHVFLNASQAGQQLRKERKISCDSQWPRQCPHEMIDCDRRFCGHEVCNRDKRKHPSGIQRAQILKIIAYDPYLGSTGDPDLGFTGHGKAWLFMSAAIEEQMERHLGHAFSLGRMGSLGVELTRIAEEFFLQPDPQLVERMLKPIIPDIGTMASCGFHSSFAFVSTVLKLEASYNYSESVQAMRSMLETDTLEPTLAFYHMCQEWWERTHDRVIELLQIESRATESDVRSRLLDIWEEEELCAKRLIWEKAMREGRTPEVDY